MRSLSKLLTDSKVTMEIIPGSVFVAPVGSATNVYTIVLRRGRRRFTVSQADRKRKMPSLTIVMESLLEDASVFDRAGSFKNWCEECGCTTEDTSAEGEYRQVTWYTSGLKDFLGEGLYKAALQTWEAKYAPIIEYAEED